MKCEEARAAFWPAGAHGRGEAAAAAGRLAAAEHLATCTACEIRLDQLAKAVLSGQEDEISCAECTARLYQAVEADLSGTAVAAEFPLVFRHLRACPECAGDLVEAGAAKALLNAGALPEPPAYPTVDLGFLRSGGTARTPERGTGQRPAGVADRAAGTGVTVGWRAWLAGVPALGWLAALGAAQADVPAAGPVGGARRPARVGVLAAIMLLALISVGAYAMWQARHTGGGAGRQTVGSPQSATAMPAGGTGRPTEINRQGLPGDELEALGRATVTASAATVAAAVAANAVGTLAAATATEVAGRRRLAAWASATRVALVRGQRTATAAPPPTAPATAAPTEPAAEEQVKDASLGGLAEFCVLTRDGLNDGALGGTCGAFPARASYSLFHFTTANRARWVFSTCDLTEMDTVLGVYPDGGFDPAQPCLNLIAEDGNNCGKQSRLSVVLDPGAYVLLATETTGDVSTDFGLRIYASEGAQGNLCHP